MEPTPPKVLKRPRCGYTFFCKDNWTRVSETLQSTNSKEIIPVLAREWNTLSDENRAPFLERAQAEKKKMQEEKDMRIQGAAATR
jgi:hypothetical protein